MTPHEMLPGTLVLYKTNYRLTFELPGLPATANNLLRQSGFRISMGNAKKWKAMVGLKTIGQRPVKPLERVKLTLVRRNYRTLDFDSLVGCFKPIVDGLVDVGILKNDTWKITGPWHVTQEYCPKGKEHIQVTVEEVSGP